MKLSSLPLLGLAVALAAPAATAQFVTGRVVDTLGNGVPGVNINARDASGSGGDVDLQNDGTDALGYFTTTFPTGTFTVEFEPPQPPASSSLVTYVSPVTVTSPGSTNLGNVVLTPGVVLSGRITNPAGSGVFGIDFDVLDSNGADAYVIYDGTNALGDFSFAAPVGSTLLQIDPTGVSGETLAPTQLAMNATGNVSFGTVQLAQGYMVAALVRDPSGSSVADCDVDVIDPVTGETRYTPGDSSNSSGFVDFVVPAGTWHFDFCPPFALHLAARRVTQAVAGTTSLGVQTLSAGFVMSGTLRDCAGVALTGGNVDLKDPSTQLDLPVCNDGANGAGFYECIVPPGTFDVCLKPLAGAGLAVDIHHDVTAASNFVLDGILGPAFTQYCFGDGSGTACPCGNASAPGAREGCLNSLGLGGKLEAEGRACVAGDTMRLQGSNMPNSSALYFQGTAQAGGGLGTVFGDGLRCASGTVIRLGTKLNSGNGSSYPVGGDLPISVRGAVPGGATRTYQCWYRNAAAFCAAATFNVTNGVQVTWAP